MVEFNVNQTTNHTVSGEFLKKGSKNCIPGMLYILRFGLNMLNNLFSSILIYIPAPEFAPKLFEYYNLLPLW